MLDEQLNEAVAFLRARLPEPPEVAIVLGSGLGHLADAVTDPVTIPFGEIPHFPEPTVAGHAGRYVAGSLEGRAVLLQAGRFHMYEGHAPATVAAPARIAARLGVGVLLLTNAAGGIDRRLEPGGAMLIDDHIDLMWRSPLAGPVERAEARFPDMSAPYDPDLQRLALDTAAELRVPLARGTYVGVTGPSFETPAEVRMLARMGADAVGMSTVPEVIVARASGTRVLALSLITNHAAGISLRPLSHAEVLETGRAAAPRVGALVRGIVKRLP